jgi:hypothetical protein
LFAYLPKQKVVATGDAVIEWSPLDWVPTLKRLEQLDFPHDHRTCQVAEKDWLRLFYSYIGHLVDVVKRHVTAGIPLKEIERLVLEEVAPFYEQPPSKYANCRPWRQAVLANIERVYAAVS